MLRLLVLWGWVLAAAGCWRCRRCVGPSHKQSVPGGGGGGGGGGGLGQQKRARLALPLAGCALRACADAGPIAPLSHPLPAAMLSDHLCPSSPTAGADVGVPPLPPSPPPRLQTPAFWGGDMSVRVTAVVKVGSKTIDVPVDVGNIQVGAAPPLPPPSRPTRPCDVPPARSARGGWDSSDCLQALVACVRACLRACLVCHRPPAADPLPPACRSSRP